MPPTIAKRFMISLKLKFLCVLLFIMFLGFSIFFYFTHTTFSEDKKLFVMNLNLTLLKAATSEIKLELKGRMDELQVFIPRIYSPLPTAHGDTPPDPYVGLSNNLKNELLAVTFYKKTGSADNPTYTILKQYSNDELIEKNHLGKGLRTALDKFRPLSLKGFSKADGMELINRSLRYREGNDTIQAPVITFLLGGSFMNNESRETIIAVDYLQTFLQEKLSATELDTELFLISRKGIILSHPSSDILVQYAMTPLDHPIIDKLQTKFTRESFELDVKGEPFLCNVGDTGFNDTLIVSQTKKSTAFIALKILYKKTFLIALFILSFALIISVFFASGLTRNIGKLKRAAEQIGTGNLDVKIDIKSNDEVGAVADSFQWMSKRLGELIKESAQKARMEDELETARLVQSTLLAIPEIKSHAIELVPHYEPATECGGDFWDAFIVGKKLTLIIGDATGHGAPAAIVTAVAKSCVSTLVEVYHQNALLPEQFLSLLNHIIYTSCKGQLLMTMCMVQLDLETGELLVCNAGHESPLCLRKNGSSSEEQNKAEVLFSRAERLGFSPEAHFKSIKTTLKPSDTILLYTDGISEAHNAEGKEWGERALKKVFAKTGSRPLEQIRKEIVQAVASHMAGTPKGDDITFVLLSWKGPESKSVEVAA